MGFDPFCSCDLGQVASHGSYPHREIAPSRLMIQAVRVKVSVPGTEGKLVLFCFFFFFFSRGSLAKAQSWGGFLDRPQEGGIPMQISGRLELRLAWTPVTPGDPGISSPTRSRLQSDLWEISNMVSSPTHSSPPGFPGVSVCWEGKLGYKCQLRSGVC